MLDVETLGTKPGCIITEIGAAVFDQADWRIVDTMDLKVSRESCEFVGMWADAETIAWWEKLGGYHEGEEVRFSIQAALGMLRHFVNFHEVRVVWCWGASFDFPILEEAFVRCGMNVPWKYYDQRCARTVCKELAPDHPRPANNHRAVDDCRVQISHLAGCMNSVAPVVRLEIPA